jgi:methyl-accepting chemotaxis protein
MRIRTKLLLGFAAVALIAVGIGVFGVVQIRKIERADTQLYQNVAVPLGYTTDIVSYFQRIRVNIRDVMLARNETEFKNYYDRIKQHDEALDRTIALYEATLKDEADRQNYQNILKAKKSYMDYLPEYMDKLNAKDMEGALTHLRGDWIKANNAMQEAVDAVVAYNIDAGKKFAEANSAIAKASNNIMLIFAVAAAVLAFLLGVLISGNIKSIINSLIKTTRELVDAAVAGRLSTRATARPSTSSSARSLSVSTRPSMR